MFNEAHGKGFTASKATSGKVEAAERDEGASSRKKNTTSEAGRTSEHQPKRPATTTAPKERLMRAMRGNGTLAGDVPRRRGWLCAPPGPRLRLVGIGAVKLAPHIFSP